MTKKKTKQTKAPKKVAKEVPVEAPKKKKHTGLKVFAILMTIFVVFPIAFVFIAFFDTSTKKVSAKDIHYENLVSQTFYNAVSNLSDTGSLGFTITEDMFDGVMMAACDKINQKQFIPKMYCYIHKSNYTFVVDLQASFFKTRVQLQTTLKQDDENILYFKINQIVIGRLPIPANWVTGIVSNFVKDDMLNNVFEQAGFRIKSHLAKAQLTYARQDFKEDVGKYVEKLGNNNEFLKLLLDVVGDNEGELLATNYDDGVSAAINLNRLVLPATEYQPLLTFNKEELENHKAIITEWLNKGWLAEDDVAKMFTYLIRGYEENNKETKGFITGIKGDFEDAIKTYVKCDETKDYQGSFVDGEIKQEQFGKYCADCEKINITPSITTDPSLSLTITLDGDSLNKYLAHEMTDAVGKTIPITYKDTDNKWNFEYIFVDNLFTQFKKVSDKPQMTMFLSLNISGYPICLELVTNDIKIEGAHTGDDKTFGGISFDIKEINFGIIPLGSTELLDTLLAMIPQNEDFTYKKGEGHELGYFSINLDPYLEEEAEGHEDDIIGYLSDESKYLTNVEGNNFIITAPKQS